MPARIQRFAIHAPYTETSATGAEFRTIPNSTPLNQMTTQILTEAIERDVQRLKSDWRKLLVSLKSDIDDEYRCSDDPDDTKPGMMVTIGFTPASEGKDASWHYQTGDNSYSGGAYLHKTWAVIYLYRRSNCTTLANDAADEILDQLAY